MERSFAAPARPWRVAAVALAAIAALAGCGKEAPPPPRPAPQVGVLEIVPKTIPFTPTFVAQTESSRQVNIVARVSGFLDRIAYQEGELVKQGQLLFVLDTKPFTAQLNAAQGELQSQQARLATAEATYRPREAAHRAGRVAAVGPRPRQGRARRGQGGRLRRAGEGRGGAAQPRATRRSRRR